METYKIVRFYAPHVGKTPRIIKRGLTLEEAQAHCNDPKTSTKNYFDGYEKE